jgi:hypothetical protein
MWIVTSVGVTTIVVLCEIVHRQHVRLDAQHEQSQKLKTLLRRVMAARIAHGGFVDTALAKAAYEAIDRPFV